MPQKPDQFVNFGPVAALLCAALLAVPANAIERKLLVASFEDVVVVGDLDVSVQTGKPVSARASGDKHVLDSLQLERTGTTLTIRVRDLLNNDQKTPVKEPLRIMLTTPRMGNVVLSGNGAVRISSMKQPDDVKIYIAGNGTVSIGNVTADRLTANIDGNGQIDIGGGAVRDGAVTIVGAGQFDGAKMLARKLRLEHNGNAKSSATVAEGTEIYNRGSGSIDIGGKGSCFIKLAGRATINCAKFDTEGKR
jgi:hypothetical protein